MYAFQWAGDNHVYALGVSGDETHGRTLGGLSEISKESVRVRLHGGRGLRLETQLDYGGCSVWAMNGWWEPTAPVF